MEKNWKCTWKIEIPFFGKTESVAYYETEEMAIEDMELNEVTEYKITKK